MQKAWGEIFSYDIRKYRAHLANCVGLRKLDSCLGRLGKPFIQFLLVGEQLLDARALLHALEMRDDVGWRGGSTKRNARGKPRVRLSLPDFLAFCFVHPQLAR